MRGISLGENDLDKLRKQWTVVSHLTDDEIKILFMVYYKHNTSIGLKERANYSLSHIVKVERNPKENCLNVYYENGEWFHYCSNGTWY